MLELKEKKELKEREEAKLSETEKDTFQRFTYEELEKRRQKELKDATERYTKIEQIRAQTTRKQIRLQSLTPFPELIAKRDRERLYKHTKSSTKQAYTALELEKYSSLRRREGAHCQPIAFTARDLTAAAGIRRSTPSWRRGL